MVQGHLRQQEPGVAAQLAQTGQDEVVARYQFAASVGQPSTRSWGTPPG